MDEQRVTDLENKVSVLATQAKDLANVSSELNLLRQRYDYHRHLGYDYSQELKDARLYNTATDGTLTMAFITNTTVKLTTAGTDRTLTSTVPVAGAMVTLILLTSGVTGCTITFGTGFKPVGTLATGTVADRVFVVSFISDGANLYETGRTVAIVA